MSQEIEFEVTKTKIVEPETFIYAILIEDMDASNKIDDFVSRNSIKQLVINSNKYMLTSRKDDLDLVKMYSISGRNSLDNFVKELTEIGKTEGGIIGCENEHLEDIELLLIKELLDEARAKAENLGTMISKSIVEISGLKIIQNQTGKWKSFPPYNKLDKRNLYSAILIRNEQNDKIDLKQTIKVKYKFK